MTRPKRTLLMPLVALVLCPILSGCFNLGFPGGGVSINGGPMGGAVQVAFPGGGVNVSGGPYGGNVSVQAPGVNFNLGIPGGYSRSQQALFPPPPIGGFLPDQIALKGAKGAPAPVPLASPEPARRLLGADAGAAGIIKLDGPGYDDVITR